MLPLALDDHDLVLGISKPISARETSLRTIASAPFRSSFSRARSMPSLVSAAKPTIV